MIRLRLGPKGRVDLRGELDLPLRASAAWGQMRHFTHFVGLDPFHTPIHSVVPFAGLGAVLTIGHQFGFFRLARTGRVLRWRDGLGYSFSDLSRRGVKRGFPHVFTYALEDRDGSRSRLSITVRGRWTANWLPRWAIRFWLHWVMNRTLDTVLTEFLGLALAQSRRGL